ncbi:MAG: Nif11-like leader peptide family natural product precursor [Lachnospiraceae bacterium]|nr:Nif11-like leader peptide family natural product precursor [Lachnospiraceae bacterium]
MSEDAKKFLEALKDNKEFETKLEDTCDRIFEEGKVSSEEAYVVAAKELGYEITLSDINEIMLESDSHKSDPLDGVAGGGLRHGGFRRRIIRQ